MEKGQLIEDSYLIGNPLVMLPNEGFVYLRRLNKMAKRAELGQCGDRSSLQQLELIETKTDQIKKGPRIGAGRILFQETWKSR